MELPQPRFAALRAAPEFRGLMEQVPSRNAPLPTLTVVFCIVCLAGLMALAVICLASGTTEGWIGLAFTFVGAVVVLLGLASKLYWWNRRHDVPVDVRPAWVVEKHVASSEDEPLRVTLEFENRMRREVPANRLAWEHAAREQVGVAYFRGATLVEFRRPVVASLG